MTIELTWNLYITGKLLHYITFHFIKHDNIISQVDVCLVKSQIYSILLTDLNRLKEETCIQKVTNFAKLKGDEH